MVALLPAAPAVADGSGSLRRQLDALTARMEAAEAREARLQDRLARLDRDLKKTERLLAAIRGRLAGRARAAYVGGLGGDAITVMVTSQDPNEVVSRLALLEAATRGDNALLDQGRRLRRTLAGQRAAIDDAQRDAASLARSLAADTARLNVLFARAESSEQESSRRRTPRASRSVRISGRHACLVGPNHSYRDTWGAPRSGGRRHKGTDVFAPYGSGSYAVTNGVIRRLSTSSAGGRQVYLRGDDGNEYFYAHMSGYAARAGQRVSAGQLIAYVGSSGNADRSAPHVHFEVHPGGGSPINPYAYVRRFCP